MFYGKHKKDGSYGFFMSSDKCLNGIEISDETWQNLMANQKNGKKIAPDETGAPVLQDVEDTRTYAQKRLAAYPSSREFLDAQVKMNSGDPVLMAAGSAQLQQYIEDCLAVKEMYPKP